MRRRTALIATGILTLSLLLSVSTAEASHGTRIRDCFRGTMMHGPFTIHRCILRALIEDDDTHPAARMFLRNFFDRRYGSRSSMSRSSVSTSSRSSRSSMSSLSSMSSRSSTGSSMSSLSSLSSSRSSTGSSVSSMSSMSSMSSTGSSASSRSLVSVTIDNFAFQPPSITVPRGTTVRWRNLDSAPHTVTGENGRGPDSPVLWNGRSYSFTFSSVGTYPYFCEIHPSMRGTVTVTE